MLHWAIRAPPHLQAVIAVDDIKVLRARQDALKTEFLDRGLERVEGECYAVLRVEAVRWSLDSKRVKQEMGEEWWIERCTTTPTISLRVSEAQVAKAARRAEALERRAAA